MMAIVFNASCSFAFPIFVVIFHISVNSIKMLFMSILFYIAHLKKKIPVQHQQQREA